MMSDFSKSSTNSLKGLSPAMTLASLRSGVTWVSYTASLPWVLPAGEGPVAVYVQFRDQVGGVSAVYSDTAILDTQPPVGSVLIDDGAAYVLSTGVTLTLAANDLARHWTPGPRSRRRHAP